MGRGVSRPGTRPCAGPVLQMVFESGEHHGSLEGARGSLEEAPERPS